MSDVERAFVWAHSPYGGTHMLLHLKMADIANDTHGHRLWVGDASLARAARCDERTVRRFKSKAIKDGLLEDLGRNPENGFKEYRFLMPNASEELADILSGGFSESDRTSHPGDRTIDPAAPDILSNAPLTNQREPNEPKRAAARALMVDEFDEAWKHYPRKLGRKAALNAYLKQRRSGSSANDLLEATKHFAEACAAKEPKFIMYGSRFFGPDEPFADFVAGLPEESWPTQSGSGTDFMMGVLAADARPRQLNPSQSIGWQLALTVSDPDEARKELVDDLGAAPDLVDEAFAAWSERRRDLGQDVAAEAF